MTSKTINTIGGVLAAIVTAGTIALAIMRPVADAAVQPVDKRVTQLEERQKAESDRYESLHEDVRELRQDVKELLRRTPTR